MANTGFVCYIVILTVFTMADTYLAETADERENGDDFNQQDTTQQDIAGHHILNRNLHFAKKQYTVYVSKRSEISNPQHFYIKKGTIVPDLKIELKGWGANAFEINVEPSARSSKKVAIRVRTRGGFEYRRQKIYRLVVVAHCGDYSTRTKLKVIVGRYQDNGKHQNNDSFEINTNLYSKDFTDITPVTNEFPRHTMYSSDLRMSEFAEVSRQKRQVSEPKGFEIFENKTGLLFNLSELYRRSDYIGFHLVSSSLDIFNLTTDGGLYLRPGESLDYENASGRNITFTVNITTTSGTIEKIVYAIVTNADDEVPVFTNEPSPFLAVVSPTAVEGTEVYRLTAVDLDTEGAIQYLLETDDSSETGRFEVASNGAIRTVGSSHFLLGYVFTLQVSAQVVSAQGTVQKSDTKSVVILVGTRPPQFFQPSYTARLSENEPANQIFLPWIEGTSQPRIEAKTFQGGAVQYTIQDQTNSPSTRFAVDGGGELKALQTFDYETDATKYQLFIVATEVSSDLQSKCPLTVELVDVNEFNPECGLKVYVGQVAENINIGTRLADSLVLTANDRDASYNFTFSVDDDHFTVVTENEMGYIEIVKTLDYDRTAGHQYRMNVTVNDTGDPPRVGVCEAIVHVTNVEDEPPEFQGVLQSTVPEDAGIGTVIMSVRAVDPDGSTVQYSFAGNQARQDIFEIGRASGEISLAKEISNQTSFNLSVVAQSSGQATPAMLLIDVEDVNNHKPEFEHCNYTPTVQEERGEGVPIIQVIATDQDRGANSHLTYSLTRMTATDQYFQINPDNGSITTTMNIDRESLSSDEIQVIVGVADHGNPILQDFCLFTVTVVDINDNRPSFSNTEQPYVVRMNSTQASVGSSIITTKARDDDEGVNAKIQYSIIGGNDGLLFKINDQTGEIMVAKTLGNLTTAVLTVLAEDGGTPRLNATAEITIHLSTENLPPVWKKITLNDIAVNETAPLGTDIATFDAIPSSHSSADLQFVFADGSNVKPPFRITSSTSGTQAILSVTGHLNYTVASKYQLTLRVQSTTNQFDSVSSYIYPTVNVIDQNNEIPRFVGLNKIVAGYAASVAENSPVGTIVYTVSAVDADHTTAYSNVTYAFKPGGDASTKFKIDAISGEITTKVQFDRECANPKYRDCSEEFYVYASDGAPSIFNDDGTPNKVQVRVIVQILDVNDNAPFFDSQNYEAQVSEDASLHSTVLTVTATDLDPTHKFKYWIRSSGTENAPFDIDQTTGSIYVARMLDFETLPNVYSMTLVVSDGLHNNTTTATITITDVNDNVPLFSQNQYRVTNITEDDTSITQTNPKSLIQVTATDADANSNLVYSLGPDTDDKFRLNSTNGIISLLGPLDREPPAGKPTFEFNVLASDGLNLGYASVVVILIDINDHFPIFDGSSLQGEVFEGENAGTFVMTVVATDADAGSNGKVTYRIEKLTPENVTLLFAIDNNSGVITTTEILDRETHAQYTLRVVATDGGNQATTATATVLVKDKNDNQPTFTGLPYNIMVSEHQTSGVVAVLSAIDLDFQDEGKLVFGLDSPHEFFGLDTICSPTACRGLLKIIQPVDFENPLQRSFTFVANVRDTSDKHDQANVFITVEDYNDNAPYFTPSHYSIGPIPEKKGKTWIIDLVNTTDLDSGDNGELDFFVAQNSTEESKFAVDENGTVSALDLDFDTHPEYSVYILAIDRGIPPLTGTATLTIGITDMSDEPPHLAEPTTHFVTENTDPNPSVFSISAEDRDRNPRFGAPFNFSLPCNNNCPCVDNPTCDSFSLQHDPSGDGGKGTAVIGTKRKFDREQQSTYLVPVVISDQSSLTATSTLTVQITDVNDHPPSPAHKQILVYSYQGKFGDIMIGTVATGDQDTDDVGDKTFTFEGPISLKGYFRIDRVTGNITLSHGVPVGSHNFTVQVHDSRFQQTVTSLVTVTIQEIPDVAVYHSGSVRLQGTTAEKFIQRPKTGAGLSDYGKSNLQNLKELLAEKLSVPTENVLIVSVINNGLFTDVRYAASGSPWYQPSKLDGLVYLSLREFETNASVKIVMVSIDECQLENCGGQGCFNQLVVSDQPVVIDAGDTAFVTMTVRVVGVCGCRATDDTVAVDCTPSFCYNGGTCVKDDWDVVSCNCTAGFTGPRCQETHHTFDGNSFALYAPLDQCFEGRTSLEFITEHENGLLLYDGPTNMATSGEPSDFILLELVGGYPRLRIDLGSGEVALSLNGINKEGVVRMQKLNNGKWHRIDIIKMGKFIKLMVDHCSSSENPPEYLSQDRTPCEVVRYTRGENTILNVHGPLQLGGRYSQPASTRAPGFNGCIKNLIHNTKMYDLHTGQGDGCASEDGVCGSGCGDNGMCTATSLSPPGYTCTCLPGYHGDTCQHPTTMRYLQGASFLDWRLKMMLMNQLKSRQLNIQLMIRTRDVSGVIFTVKSKSLLEYITLEINQRILQLSYEIGNGPIVLSLDSANITDGQWHTVTVKRYDREFFLMMDTGEGRFYVDSVRTEDLDGLLNFGSYDVAFDVRQDQVYAGASVSYDQPMPAVHDLDLIDTCMNDVRLEMSLFPMIDSENSLSNVGAELLHSLNTRDSCERQDCVGITCSENSVCIPLWGFHECRCVDGYTKVAGVCVVDDLCASSPCHGDATCTAFKGQFFCTCPPHWTGKLCNQGLVGDPEDPGLSVAGIAGIVVAALLLLLLIIILAVMFTLRNRHPKDQQIIYEDMGDDLIENVMYYDEDGAGEEDTGYDLACLQKPREIDSDRDYFPIDVDRMETTNLRSEPDYGGGHLSGKLDRAINDLVGSSPDTLRDYAYEGMNSEAGSLSSLNTSSSSSDDHNYDYLHEWGPKFGMLASMYNDNHEDYL
ncbi:hypothetical protein ScPMuIL_006623 [Solemya velum]